MVKRSAIITGATVVFCALLCSGIVFANDDASVDDVSIVVPTACTLSGTGTGTHTATINPGQYVADIGTTTLKALCNDANGFAIYATGYTGSVVGDTNSNKLVGQNTSETIVTGLATSGNTSNWAMKLATDPNATYPVTIESAPNTSGGADASFSAYHVVPNEYTKVATRLQSTDVGTNATGSTLTTTYATYISAGQVGDTYNGKVIYTLVHPNNEIPVQPQPSTPGYINYYANTNLADGTMGRQAATDGDTATLIASNFSRDGYGFAGWSDAYDYTTNPDAHFYGPNESIVVPEGTTANGLSLYAIWVESAGTMQSNATSVCNGLTSATYNDEDDADESTWSITADLSSISALTDIRDGQTYAIAKLTDGNCWMIENLRLADTHQEGANTVPTTLTITNTNNPLNDGTNVTLKHNYSDISTFNTLSPNSDTAYDENTNPSGWCSDNSVACGNQSRLRTDNTANRVTYTTTTTMSQFTNLYLYGNYYNWYSATAGRGVYDQGRGDTEGDLCPFSWHLPTGHSFDGSASGEFGLLSNSLGGYHYSNGVAQYMSSSSTPKGEIMSKRIRHFPNNFVYAGLLNNPPTVAVGAGSLYLSSTSRSNGLNFNLAVGGASVEPGSDYDYKYKGGSVRCILTANP